MNRDLTKKDFLWLVLFVALISVLLVGCSENELFVIPGEIVFHPRTLATKALINPGITGEGASEFPAEESFGVTAIHRVEGREESVFMDNVEVVNESGKRRTVSSESYVWPSAGMIDFYAYYPYETKSYIDESGSIKIEDIVLGSVIGEQVDPMIAVSKGQVAEYQPTVELMFNHISSQIVVTACERTDTLELQNKIILKEVSVKGMCTSGDYIDTTGNGKGTWFNLGDTTDFTCFCGSHVLSDEIDYLCVDSCNNCLCGCNAFVVVPQPLGTQTIDVTYDVDEFYFHGKYYPAQKDQFVSVQIPIDEDELMKPGKRYVYHLEFSLNGILKRRDDYQYEITFNPSTTIWNTEVKHDICIDCASIL